MSCQPSSDAKYKKRASPPYPANECCDMRRQGNDGRMYKSKANKNGTCVWRLVKVLGEKAAKKPAVVAKQTKEDELAKKEEAEIKVWLPQIGHKDTGVKAPSKFLYVTVQPLLVYDAKHTMNFSLIPNENIVNKKLVKWYKDNIESIADYHKIKLLSVWAQGTRICMMFDQTKPSVSMDTFKNHVKEPDDDGNYPIKINKQTFLISGSDCHVYESNKK